MWPRHKNSKRSQREKADIARHAGLRSGLKQWRLATLLGLIHVEATGESVPIWTSHAVLGDYLIVFMGFITFASGALGAMNLLFEEVGKTERVPWRYYAMVVGLISGGLTMIGIGQ